MTTNTGVARRHPYIWPTWISGLIAGEKQCWWAAWFKAHYQNYEKREDDNANRLNQWKAEHAQEVRQVAENLRNIGATVTIEDQNAIHVGGKLATVGGKPDIVATWPDDSVTIVDRKTGKRREADYWQVIIYIVLLTLKTKGEQENRYEGRPVSGVISYRDGDRRISPADAEAGASLVFSAIKTVGAELAPVREPSASECRFCDIACCPDRVVPTDTSVATEEF